MRETVPDLVALDDAMQRLVRVVRRPAYRERVLEGVAELPGINTIRVLRSVEARAQAGDGPTVGSIAGDLEIGDSSASRAVASAVASGLVRRTTAPEDLRRVRLELTESGELALARATDNRISLLGMTTASWSDDEVRLLETLLRRLVEHYEALGAGDATSIREPADESASA